MAKLKTDPIGESDLTKYLESSSDFAFEQEIYSKLLEMDFDAQHGGTYTDPATGIPREFDIRGHKWLKDRNNESESLLLSVAVECKSLSKSFPLLIECVPRTRDERFHDVVSTDMCDPVSGSKWRTKRIVRQSMYVQSAAVGKSCCQVGHSTNGGFTATDSAVFPKWTQALASIADLFVRAQKNPERNPKPQLTALIPLVVVPDECLWMVEYDGRGNRKSKPMQIDHVSYWVNKSLSDPVTSMPGPKFPFSISHIEFCTKWGLECYVTELEKRPRDSLFAIQD